ncbi:MAG: hypothetical protein QXN75_02915 [Thermoproteota archaeon]|nr:hypothetical protein [Candidatus Brockarchaeota archaeon]
MSSDKMLQIIVKKESNSGDLCKFDDIALLLSKYRQVVVTMQGFERREILEAIRPLATTNISTTLIVYNGKYESSEDYDEKIVIGQDG